ncbi:DUF2231 domain-containing protein [Luteithermobacter gelatinilyticus]|uniref:DUF2231 domain-containing protein n=1 Tax=Luteithermobacter gelatinilyticus TaxID=2582913 RepID=UPI0011072425|nr:DUF2231 domain-containing protein [Luteithermobacter gelatinilyticus]|tara:strand:- start:3210 stop:3776 length:567 start_codon:yes stop_codon:yes gene_type:complete
MEIIPNWHPVFVHFTIALYSVATLLFLIGRFFPSKIWAEKITIAAYINLWTAGLITFVTVAAGYYAYNTVAHDGPSHLAMTDHRNWGLTTAVVFWGLVLWSVVLYRDKKVHDLFLVALVVATGLLSVTGYKGGEVVYRHGIGVMSLPESGGEGHDHHHGEAGENHEHPVTPAQEREHDDSHQDGDHSH